MPARPFVELLHDARSGDPDALSALLHHVEARLRRQVEDRLGTKLRAELRDSDVLQNAYVQLIRSLGDFRGTTEGEFVAWVYSIIENDIRRQTRWFGAAKRRPPDQSGERNALARILLDTPPTPSAEMIADEERSLLDEALASLPEDYQQVIELAVGQELPHEEIADRMDRTPAASRMLLNRARAALSAAIERLESER